MAERTLQSLANRLLELDGEIERRSTTRISEEDTYAFVEKMKNTNTSLKTKYDVKRFKDWLQNEQKNENFEETTAKDLDLTLAMYFLSLRKADSTEYEPDTIWSYQSSIHRYLQDKNYPNNIMKDDIFRHSRNVLSSKRKALKQSGLGNKKLRADEFTDDEISTLREKNLLGDGNPEAMINSLWLNNTLHFGLRGRQEHVTMLWGDLELNVTAAGREYLTFTERATKTRNGVVSDPRQFMPKMFDQPGDPYCPVALYKSFADKRPEQMCTPESRFYLTTNSFYGQNSKSSGQWFLAMPMGKNKLGTIAKTMSEKAELTARHVNHSGRKTCITKLLNANVAPTEVAQLSGHKNLMSLNHYSTVNLEKQIQMSTIIHGRGDAGRSLSEPVASTSTAVLDPVFDQQHTDSDDDLASASQQIEEALFKINEFEDISTTNHKEGQSIDLPVIQSPGGTLQLTNQSFKPQNLFNNCRFNGAVTIVLKK